MKRVPSSKDAAKCQIYRKRQSENNIFQCKYCPLPPPGEPKFEFSTRDSLKSHMLNRHQGKWSPEDLKGVPRPNLLDLSFDQSDLEAETQIAEHFWENMKMKIIFGMIITMTMVALAMYFRSN